MSDEADSGDQPLDSGHRSTEPLRDSADEGQHLGPYRLLSRIGEGGMGEVWAARQESPIRRQVAIKFIKAGMETRHVLARFESERQALALMDHPNIAKVFDAGTTDNGRPYFVMEYVKGMALHKYCDEQRLSTRDRLELMIQVCEGVQHAHQKGVLHRDLKPSNVLVELHGERAFPKIIDFGVAKAMAQPLTEATLYTQMGEIIGTPTYMSPEQASINELDVDTRTDVYSLGVMLYHVLVGIPPFDFRSPNHQLDLLEIQRRIREDDPPRPSTRASTADERSAERADRRRTDKRGLARQLRGDLDWIVMKAMEKDRSRRYASASELAQDIRRYLQHEPVHAGPPHVGYRVRKFARRHRVGVSVVAGLFLLLCGFSVVMAVQADRIASERDRANREAEAANQTADFLVGLFQVSDPEESRGATVSARELLDAGSVRIDHELADQPELRARMMGTMGRVYMSLGLYESSEDLLREAVALQEEHAGAGSPSTATALVDLGNFELRMGNYEAADDVFARAVAIREDALGPVSPEIGRVLRRQAELRRHQTRYEEGEALYLRAIELLRGADAPDQEEIAQALSDLGVLYMAQGRREDARRVSEESLAIRERILPPDHPDLGELYNNLAAMDWQLGDLEAAEANFDRALANREHALGPDHPDVAQTLHNIGALYMVQERYDEASEMVLRALEIHRRAYGPEHPMVAHSMHTLGVIQRNAGNFEEAFRWLEDGLAMRQATLGPDHEKVGLSHLALGQCHAMVGEWSQAEEHARQGHRILKASLGDENRFTKGAAELLERSRREQGKVAGGSD